MLSHRTTPENLAQQGRIMADAGCQCVYVVDSAGALLPDRIADRVAALVTDWGRRSGRARPPELSLGIANSLAGYHAGARQIDPEHCARSVPVPETRRRKYW